MPKVITIGDKYYPNPKVCIHINGIQFHNGSWAYHLHDFLKKDIILYCKVVNPWKEGEVEKTEGDSSHQHYSINSKGFPSPSSKTI